MGHTLPRPIEKQVLAADTLAVEANVRRSWAWPIDTKVMKDCVLTGRFHAYGGSGNDVRVLVLDEPNYTNFWNGHKATSMYDSGVLTTGDFKVPVTVTGKYYVVLDNTFSMFTNKAVMLNLVAEHTE